MTTATGPAEESIPLLLPDRPRAFEGLRRRCKRVWAAMTSDPSRGPADYDSQEDTMRLLISIIRKQTENPGGGGYHERDKSTKSVVVGVGIALLAAFIIGGWKLSSDFAGLQSEFTEWKKSTDRRIDALERRP